VAHQHGVATRDQVPSRRDQAYRLLLTKNRAFLSTPVGQAVPGRHFWVDIFNILLHA
jgi:hypothetical protein